MESKVKTFEPLESLQSKGKKRKNQPSIEKYFSAGPSTSKNLKKSANDVSAENESEKVQETILENLQEHVLENKVVMWYWKWF